MEQTLSDFLLSSFFLKVTSQLERTSGKLKEHLCFIFTWVHKNRPSFSRTKVVCGCWILLTWISWHTSTKSCFLWWFYESLNSYKIDSKQNFAFCWKIFLKKSKASEVEYFWLQHYVKKQESVSISFFSSVLFPHQVYFVTW